MYDVASDVYTTTYVKEMSAALAVIRVHVLPLVPIARSQANVCRTTTNDKRQTTNIQTAVDIIKYGARSGSPQLLVNVKHLGASLSCYIVVVHSSRLCTVAAGRGSLLANCSCTILAWASVVLTACIMTQQPCQVCIGTIIV